MKLKQWCDPGFWEEKEREGCPGVWGRESEAGRAGTHWLWLARRASELMKLQMRSSQIMRSFCVKLRRVVLAPPKDNTVGWMGGSKWEGAERDPGETIREPNRSCILFQGF